MFFTRIAQAGALAGLLFVTGCAGSSLISKPWSSLRPSAKASKPKKAERASPRTGPSDDIPSADSVGLAMPK